MKKNAKRSTIGVLWCERYNSVFDESRATLTLAPLLSYPDFKKPFHMDTDCYCQAVGCVLYQVKERRKKAIPYDSQTLEMFEKT